MVFSVLTPFYDTMLWFLGVFFHTFIEQRNGLYALPCPQIRVYFSGDLHARMTQYPLSSEFINTQFKHQRCSAVAKVMGCNSRLATVHKANGLAVF